MGAEGCGEWGEGGARTTSAILSSAEFIRCGLSRAFGAFGLGV